jgi:hypothetical protein
MSKRPPIHLTAVLMLAACGTPGGTGGGEPANEPPAIRGGTPPGETDRPIGADTTGGTATTAGVGTAGSPGGR